MTPSYLKELLDTLTKLQPDSNYFFFPERVRGRWLERGPVQRLWIPIRLRTEIMSRLSKSSEVFFTPNGLPFPKRTTPPSDHPMWVLVIDLDPPNTLAIVEQSELPHPTAIVCSGRGHHIYWTLTESIPLHVWKNLEKRLANLLGADPASATPTQVFRLPGSPNPRTNKVAHVLSLAPQAFYDPEIFFERLKLVPERRVSEPEDSGSQPPVLSEEDRLALVELWKHRMALWAYAWLSLRGKPITKMSSLDRSQLLWSVAKSLYESGFSKEETFQLIAGAPWDKFTYERRPLDLWRMIQQI